MSGRRIYNLNTIDRLINSDRQTLKNERLNDDVM